MNTQKIDLVVREALMTRELPIHFYVPFLHWALKAVREIHRHLHISLKGVKAIRVDIDQEDYSAKLPNDFVDYIVIGAEVSNKIRAMGTKDYLSHLTGQAVYDHPVVAEPDSEETSNRFLRWFRTYTPVGGVYGYGGGIMEDSFKVIPEMNKIQFDPGINYTQVYMAYVTDGFDPSVRTEVHPYAIQSIEDYIIWKYKEKSRKYNRLEVRESRKEFYNQLRTLGLSLNKLTITDILRSKKKAFRRTYK